MNDLDLYLILSNKDIYYKYYNTISKYLDTDGLVILSDMDTWFSADASRKEIDWAAFATWFGVVKHSDYKPERMSYFKAIFDKLQGRTRDETLEKDIVTKIIDEGYAAAIATKASSIAAGGTGGSISDIETLIEDRNKEVGRVDKIDSYIVSDDVDDLAEHVVGGHGYDWRLDELNRSLGPLRQGDFIIIGARPESGKTTMLAAESTFMAPQMKPEQSVVWFNNEEEGRKVKWRVIQSALSWTKQEMLDDLTKVREEYEKLMGRMDKIIIVDKKSPALHINDVRPILDKYQPGLIIFDQLRKVHGYDKEAQDYMRLQHMFQFAREIAKEYAPVINVHQAGGTAEGVRYIEMNHLHGSQTDIQGEADAILTIGRSHEPGLEYSRFLYLPKNKLAGGKHSDESLRHGKFEVLIDATRARFESPAST
jgi:replicative DNA helicase